MFKWLKRFWRKVRLCSFILFGEVFTKDKRDVLRIVHKYMEICVRDFNPKGYVTGRAPFTSLLFLRSITDLCMAKDSCPADYTRYIIVLAKEFLDRELYEREIQ